MDRGIERRWIILFGLTVLVALAIGAAARFRPDPPLPPNPVYPAPVLESKLSYDERRSFYHMPMGTGIFEYYGFMALEDPKTKKLFEYNLQRFGFLIDMEVPAGLPIGLTLEKPGGLPVNAIGINCSACHVGEFKYDGQSFRVEGAPNLIDLIGFKQDLVASVEHAMSHPRSAFRLIRNMAKQHKEAKEFLEHVPDYDSMHKLGDFGGGLTSRLNDIVVQEQKRAKFGSALSRSKRHLTAAHASKETISSEHDIDDTAIDLLALSVPKDSSIAGVSQENRKEMVESTMSQWAYSVRLLLAWAETVKKNLGDKSLMTAPGPGRADAWGALRSLFFGACEQTAPSSIPPLWNTANFARYQWNGTTNTNVERGFSAAIGAGAFFDSKTGVSPIRMDNLMQLEEYAAKFAVPKWPNEYFPAIDERLRKRGETLYIDHCTSCHDAGHPNPKTGLTEFPTFEVEELGTDATYLENFNEPVGNEPFAEAMQSILHRIEVEYYRENKTDDSTKQKWEPESRRPGTWDSPTTYPAKSMDGIWATAPFLHNNSVPTLYDLLLPASERPKLFFVGTREFDPERVGFRYDVTANPKGFEFDTRLKGNGNSGHEYGTSLSDEERYALVEYLKTK